MNLCKKSIVRTCNDDNDIGRRKLANHV